jgi:CopG family transcriptional regulator, nickel-responsive regulator
MHHGEPMQRITIVLDDELLAEVDRLTVLRGYQNRSEAIRDLAREGIRQATEEEDIRGDCIAALVYAYDFRERDMTKRLAKAVHDHHDLSVATLQVHLDHDSRMEVAVLRGDRHDVGHFAEHIIAERGVRYGRLVALPAEMKSESHAHSGAKKHKHLHVRVRKAG